MAYRIKNIILDPRGFTREQINHIDGYLSTGLVDKHGKEIFDGDIVKTPWGVGKVEFYQGAFMVNGGYLASFAPEDLEVVKEAGN